MPLLESRNLKVVCILCCLLSLLSACATQSPPEPTVKLSPPTPVLAGGEPILSHSQIFFHATPVPVQADFDFSSAGWSLSGHNSCSTHSISIPNCSPSPPPKP